MNIKGVFQIWMHDGSYHEIDLKECHGWTRTGCLHCPDFAAEHSDVATGGIGEDNDWTLTIVRTELGEEVINRMIADGSIVSRPAQDGREGDEAAAPAVDRQPPPLARVRRPRPGDRRPPTEEENPRTVCFRWPVARSEADRTGRFSRLCCRMRGRPRTGRGLL